MICRADFRFRTYLFIFAIALTLVSVCPKQADAESNAQVRLGSAISKFGQRIADIWNAPGLDIHLPVIMWHNRLLYDSDRAAAYNEMPLGFGFGKSILDEKGNRHRLYALFYVESKYRPSYQAGYIFTKQFGDPDGLAWGLGFSLSLIGREPQHYLPMPLPLPIIVLSYRNLDLQLSYLPGFYNKGNVLFGMLSYRF